MNDATTVALSPETVLQHMMHNGVTDVVWLPDSETNWLYLLMKADPSLRLIGVTREGHACSIAAGLHAGGKKPLILIQNTGMMESGDSIRGWLLGMNVPVVLMVGYRGFREKYTSKIVLYADHLTVDVGQTEGPFRKLENHWRFTPLEAEDGAPDFIEDGRER